MINIQKLRQALELLCQIRFDIDSFGNTTINKVERFKQLINNFSIEEKNLFEELIEE